MFLPPSLRPNVILRTCLKLDIHAWKKVSRTNFLNNFLWEGHEKLLSKYITFLPPPLHYYYQIFEQLKSCLANLAKTIKWHFALQHDTGGRVG